MSSCPVSWVWWYGSTPLAVSQVLTHPHLNSCVFSRMLRVNVSLPSCRADAVKRCSRIFLRWRTCKCWNLLDRSSWPKTVASRTHCKLGSKKESTAVVLQPKYLQQEPLRCRGGDRIVTWGNPMKGASLGNPRSGESRAGSGHKKRCIYSHLGGWIRCDLGRSKIWW